MSAAGVRYVIGKLRLSRFQQCTVRRPPWLESQSGKLFHPFSRLVDVSLSRWASFVSRLVFIAGLPLFIAGLPRIRRSVHCPSRASTGSSHCPSYRDSATPRPLVPSVAQLLTQLDASVRWEDVPISSTGSSFNTHPFVLLLTLISPLSYGGRETVFEPFERSILSALLDGEISILVAFATKIVKQHP